MGAGEGLLQCCRGVLVVWRGGGEAVVLLRLSQAVAALTGLGSDRISICQGTN